MKPTLYILLDLVKKDLQTVAKTVDTTKECERAFASVKQMVTSH